MTFAAISPTSPSTESRERCGWPFQGPRAEKSRAEADYDESASAQSTRDDQRSGAATRSSQALPEMVGPAHAVPMLSANPTSQS